jgi:hypothetical protein
MYIHQTERIFEAKLRDTFLSQFDKTKFSLHSSTKLSEIKLITFVAMNVTCDMSFHQTENTANKYTSS